MTVQQRTSLAYALAAIAWLLALGASAAGLLVGGLYRDNEAMVAQAQGTDLATLFAAVPALGIGLWLARRGSEQARLVVLGSLGYLVYTYAIYAFQVVISPVTPLHIAILGLATWSLILGVPALFDMTARPVATSLPRRTTAGFLAVVVVMFAGLWLGQIVSAIRSGALPAAVADLDLPTSAVYTLDLAFALPILALAAALLVRREPRTRPAIASLVFIVLMALSILGLFVVQAARALPIDPSLTIGFSVIVAIASVLAGLGLRSSREVAAVRRPGVAHIAR